jgi:hypothetical protein
MNTNILKLLSCVALAACSPALQPEARPVLAWQPDFNPSAIAGDKETPSASYDELLEHSIFAPTRRPFVPPIPPVVEPPPEPVAMAPASEPPPPPPTVLTPPPAPMTDPQQFQLKGIMQAGNQVKALIVTPENPEGTWLANEAHIMGWTLVRIERNSVILKGDGRNVTLQQYTDKPANDSSKAAADAQDVRPNQNPPALN